MTFREKLSNYQTLLALIYFFTGVFLIQLFLAIYNSHPYYQGYLSDANQIVINTGGLSLAVILLADTIYKWLDNYDFRETDLVTIYLGALIGVGKFFTKIGFQTKSENLEYPPRLKVALLYLLVKFFFLPIMLTTVVANSINLFSFFQNLSRGYVGTEFDSIYHFLINLIFLLDTLIFTFGYLFAAKWLGNQVKSVEPTTLGWVVALSTYPPFNSITGQLIPMAKTGVTVIGDPHLVRFLQILVLLFYVGFLAASISLGTRGSNLTSRGVVTWGTYAWVRHPAYTFKLAAWFIEGILFAANIHYFLGWLGFSVIYFLRAWTEERHLLKTDMQYVVYKNKVKYWFIPRVF